MPLQPLPLALDPSPLPPAVGAFLVAAAAATDAALGRPASGRSTGFHPSDYELVYRSLAALRAAVPDARTFCEWGSGLGVVAGLAVGLGYEAYGIEIDGGLCTASRALLAAHRLRAQIVHGSFVPADQEPDRRASDLDARTVWSGSPAYADMDRDPDEFDVVFAYPWPAEEDVYRALFRRSADYGAVFVTYSGGEGVRAWRKVAGRADRRR